jgi:hypothetical protein
MELPDLTRLKVGDRPPSATKIPSTQSPPPPSFEPDLDIDMDNFTPDPVALAPPKSPEMVAREEELRVIISLYKVKFPTELLALSSELDPLVLASMDAAQLEALRDRCDKILGAGSGADNKKKMFNTCLYVIEKVGCYSGIQCEGLTAVLLADPDYQKDLMRLALKYLSVNDCRPELTVGMKIISTAVQLHASAELKAQQQAIQVKLATPPPATAEKIAQVSSKFPDDNIA